MKQMTLFSENDSLFEFVGDCDMSTLLTKSHAFIISHAHQYTT